MKERWHGRWWRRGTSNGMDDRGGMDDGDGGGMSDGD